MAYRKVYSRLGKGKLSASKQSGLFLKAFRGYEKAPITVAIYGQIAPISVTFITTSVYKHWFETDFSICNHDKPYTKITPTLIFTQR